MVDQDWREYTSPNGDFSVRFPGEPTIEPYQNGRRYRVDIEHPPLVFMVSHFDLPMSEEVARRPDAPDVIFQEVAETARSKHVGEERPVLQPLRYGPYHGLEVRIKAPEAYFWLRKYLVGIRMYGVEVFSEVAESFEAEHFHSSFRLTVMSGH